MAVNAAVLHHRKANSDSILSSLFCYIITNDYFCNG